MTPYEALEAAVEKAGSQSELARICDVSQPAVWKWLKQSKRAPAEAVLPIERATGISRHELRPDIYPLHLHDGPRRRVTDHDPDLGPWDTGDYGNQFDILDFTGGAVL